MSLLDKGIKKFLDEKYPNERVWKRRLRFDTIKNYALWSMKSNIEMQKAKK